MAPKPDIVQDTSTAAAVPSSYSTISAGHISAAHHRHSHPLSRDEEEEEEQSPLVTMSSYQKFVHRHMSMENSDAIPRHRKYQSNKKTVYLAVLAFLLGVAALVHVGWKRVQSRPVVVSVEEADEYLLDIGDGLQIWFRTWGRADGIPIVFIHGGPGNAIADYFGNSNKRFFADQNNTFFVVEIDQRGTGKSQPSVRDDWHNMKYYQDISIDQICADFEIVREYLGIDKWLVWGGSFGSTLGINYGERYPQNCLALILRGIYLDTAEEVGAVYGRDAYVQNRKRVNEFDIFFRYVDQYVNDTSKGNDFQPLDPNDAYRIMKTYHEMIVSGDPHAIWHWFVFENNLMETDPKYLLDPDKIDEEFYAESLSVAFFETRLWLHGSYEHLSNLMDPEKIDKLTMPIWVCQGQHDEVCPPNYARRFTNVIEMNGMATQITSRFVNGSHEDTDPAIAECLKFSLQEFIDYQRRHWGIA